MGTIDKIDKKAMIHYLNTQIAKNNVKVKRLEKSSSIETLLNTKQILELNQQNDTFKGILQTILMNKINDAYDKHCITNGLARTGKVFD